MLKNFLLKNSLLKNSPLKKKLSVKKKKLTNPHNPNSNLNLRIGTLAIVGSISLIAATTRSDNHLAMGGPLAVGLGVVLAASIGQIFLPASG